ncbi:MAG: hypothetical protein WC957_00860, partial [Candidatus Neomarinimicrobiota bacterium]|jgi:hypothetical protein
MADRVLNDVRLGEYMVGMDDLERNPTARATRFLEKSELVKMIWQGLGPQAIDFRWWLEESDLGDIDKLLERIEQALAQAGVTAEQQEALQGTQALLQLAKQKQQLDGGGGSGLSGQTRGPVKAAV